MISTYCSDGSVTIIAFMNIHCLSGFIYLSELINSHEWCLLSLFLPKFRDRRAEEGLLSKQRKEQSKFLFTLMVNVEFPTNAMDFSL